MRVIQDASEETGVGASPAATGLGLFARGRMRPFRAPLRWQKGASDAPLAGPHPWRVRCRQVPGYCLHRIIATEFARPNASYPPGQATVTRRAEPRASRGCVYLRAPKAPQPQRARGLGRPAGKLDDRARSCDARPPGGADQEAPKNRRPRSKSTPLGQCQGRQAHRCEQAEPGPGRARAPGGGELARAAGCFGGEAGVGGQSGGSGAGKTVMGLSEFHPPVARGIVTRQGGGGFLAA